MPLYVTTTYSNYIAQTVMAVVTSTCLCMAERLAWKSVRFYVVGTRGTKHITVQPLQNLNSAHIHGSGGARFHH